MQVKINIVDFNQLFDNCIKIAKKYNLLSNKNIAVTAGNSFSTWESTEYVPRKLNAMHGISALSTGGELFVKEFVRRMSLDETQ